MERVRRPRISTAEKTEVWTRWKHGESLSDIGRALDRVPGAIFHVLAAHGGVAPPQRTRSWLALTLHRPVEPTASTIAKKSNRSRNGYRAGHPGEETIRHCLTTQRGNTLRWPE